MNEVLEAAILGIIQGITEWLPVSSSGHLVIGEQLLNLNSSLLLDTLLHLATLVAVCVVFWKDIAGIAKALLHWDTKAPEFKLGVQVIIATIPVVVVGLLAREYIEKAFSSLTVVSLSLILTGLILWSTKYAKAKSEISNKNALWIGVAQVLALLPGVSRSGTTIAAGMHLGINRLEAAKFSFLIFVPAVAGAFVLQSFTADWSTLYLPSAFIGMLVAFAVSVVALRWLLGVIRHGKLHYFAWYCIILGIVVYGIRFVN